MQSISWYPGHMKKTREMIAENMKAVDVVIELLDARIPLSSRNPVIGELTASKPRIIVLNKSDLADAEANERWQKALREEGAQVVLTDANRGQGTGQLLAALSRLRDERNEGRERKRQLRAMIVGIPNVGKSSLINRLTGRKAAVTGNKPGVTRGKQWIAIDSGLEMLDTPGILWPKFDSQSVGESLALTNAIKADVIDREALAANFMLRLRDLYPGLIEQRYKFTPDPEKNGYELLEDAGRKRGFLVSGGEVDIERMAATLLKEFHDGKLGRISLEAPPKDG